MTKRYDLDDSEYNYAKLLKRPEWREKSKEIKAKRPRCEKCGRTGVRLAVHHPSYEYGRLPWDYPDDAYMVVCSGRCHRAADEDREEQEENARISQRCGWQGAWGKKLLPPREKELRLLAKYEAEFKAWLVEKEIPPPQWDWKNETWPLWYFWNEFSDQFLAEGQHSEDRQLRLTFRSNLNRPR
jgi:hypothetical protein